ncbi:PadR family transcriptional regulator [Micromonospora sp. M12]
MPKRRKVGNLLALAVLSALVQRPMHPYEIATTLRSWGKDQDMEFKWGSFYTVIRNMDKHGMVEAVESLREGRRPERTVYRITDAGRAELVDWARELVSTPMPEHPASGPACPCSPPCTPTRPPTCCGNGSTCWMSRSSGTARRSMCTCGRFRGCSWWSRSTTSPCVPPRQPGCGHCSPS